MSTRSDAARHIAVLWRTSLEADIDLCGLQVGKYISDRICIPVGVVRIVFILVGVVLRFPKLASTHEIKKASIDHSRFRQELEVCRLHPTHAVFELSA